MSLKYFSIRIIKHRLLFKKKHLQNYVDFRTTNTVDASGDWD